MKNMKDTEMGYYDGSWKSFEYSYLPSKIILSTMQCNNISKGNIG